MKKLLHKLVVSLTLLISTTSNIFPHTVQVAYTTNCEGNLRLYVEHWHNAINPSSTTMTIKITIGTVISTITSSPGGGIQNTLIGSLPYAPVTVVGACNGGINPIKSYANMHNDWVYYDYPSVPCGTAMSITILSGNNEITQDGCSMFPITIPNIIIPCLNVTDQAICVGSTFNASNFPVFNGTTWTWTNNNTATGLAANGTGNIGAFTAANVATTQTSTIIVQNSCNTNLKDTFHLTVSPKPHLIITDQLAVCAPNKIDITAAAITNGSTNLGALSYWNNFLGTNSLTNPSSVPSGTYYIQSTIAPGCADTQAVNVTLNPLPVVVITNPPPVCTPSTIDITLPAITAGTTGGSPISYWNDLAATSPLVNSTSIATSGTYYIIVATAAGCKDTQAVSVTINPLPVLTVTNPTIVCDSVTVDLTLPVITAGSTVSTVFTYWVDPMATIPITNPATINIGGTYYIQSSSAAGCKEIKPVTVAISSPPNLVITDPLPVCFPGTIDITSSAITSSTAGMGTLSYWNDLTATIPIASPNAIAASGTYYIQTTSTIGCKNIKPVSVSINLLPALVITHPTAVCYPNTVDITLPGVTMGSTSATVFTYWKDPTATILITNPTAINTSGTYYMQSATAAGCKDIQPVTVTIHPKPSLVITNPLPKCVPGTIDVTSPAITSGTIGTGTLSYWNDTAATIPLATPNTIPSSGTYYIQTTSPAGCKDIKPVSVTINPLPKLAITNPPGVCFPYTSDITLSAITAGSIGTGTLTYWSDPFTTVSLPSPNAIGTSGTYYIRIINSSGCADIKPVVVTIKDKPIASFSVDVPKGCPIHCVNFSDLSSITTTTINSVISNWDWNFGDGQKSNLQSPTHCYLTSDFYDVTLTVTSNRGCTETLTIPNSIEVYPLPTADFNSVPSSATVVNPTITFINQSSSDVVYWQWEFGDGISFINTTTPSPSHLYPNVADTNYLAQLIVQNAHGCLDTIAHPVVIGADFTFFIPNAFTPNGDGINDEFLGQGIGIKEYNLWIYDRWGNLIFYENDINDPWDGNANEGVEVAQQDVYVWKVTIKDIFNKKHNYMGIVTLIR